MTEKFGPELMRGSLDLMVLSVLSAEPKYGYLIGQSLREASRGMIDVKAGTMYPLLHRLEDDKLIKCRWDDSTGRRRKWYELTTAGHRRLKQQANQWYEYSQCLMEMLKPILAVPPKPA